MQNHNCQPLGFWMTPYSEGCIGLTLNEGERKKWFSERKKEEKEQKGGQGLFEAADLFITVLLLLTLIMNNETRQLSGSRVDS